MGCVQSRSADELAAAARSKEIDRALKLEREALKDSREFKVVVLGSRGSGKSTLIRNMKLVMAGMSEEERESYKPAVISNAVHAVLALVQATKGAGIVSDDDVDKLTEISRQTKVSMTPEVAAILRRLCSNDRVQGLLQGKMQSQLEDYQHHFLNSLDRILEPCFCPTNADILYLRTNSANGISLEATWHYAGLQWQVHELGGSTVSLGRLLQKHLHLCEHSVLLICASFERYDTDEGLDDLAGTLELVRKLSLSETATVVILTKQDLFTKKLSTVPLQRCFPEYEGPQDDPEAAVQFISRKCKSDLRSKSVHFCNSSTLDSSRTVVNAIKQVTLDSALKNYKLM